MQLEKKVTYSKAVGSITNGKEKARICSMPKEKCKPSLKNSTQVAICKTCIEFLLTDLKHAAKSKCSLLSRADCLFCRFVILVVSFLFVFAATSWRCPWRGSKR